MLNGRENPQGFDRSKRRYVRLDCDAWLAAHRIREEGAKRGKENRPGTDETLPDEMHRKIESWIRQRALDCKGEVSKYINEELDHLHDLRNIWERENPEIDLDALITQHCQNLQDKADQSISDLENQRTEFSDALRDFKNFRKRHRLLRVAHYPTSLVAHWLWIPVAAIIESFISANLLGSVSRGGVIEGWMVALVLTSVNILLGIGAGYIWRFTNIDFGYIRVSAYFGSSLCVAVALVWDIMAGHVRDVYVLAEKAGVLEAPDEAFATAYHAMIERPLPWESLPSAGLALVGIAVFALTTYKMYTADDPFPGYGAKHRKFGTLRERYQDDLNDARDGLGSLRKKGIVAIEEVKSRYEIDRAGWESVQDRLKMVVNDYPVNLRQYNNDLIYLLSAYRDANLSTRTTKAPPFFEDIPAIDEEAIRPPDFSIPKPPEWGDIVKKANAGFEKVEETYAKLLSRYQMLGHVFDQVDDAL